MKHRAEATSDAKKPRGRPSGGAEGQRVRDYPAILARVPPRAHEIVLALSEVKRQSRSQVLTDMIIHYHLAYLKDREPGVYRRVEEMVDSWKKSQEEMK